MWDELAASKPMLSTLLALYFAVAVARLPGAGPRDRSELHAARHAPNRLLRHKRVGRMTGIRRTRLPAIDPPYSRYAEKPL